MCRSTLISQHHQAFNLHNCRSVLSSQPPSSLICAELSTSITPIWADLLTSITDLQFSSIHHCWSAIFAIHHFRSVSQGVVFSNFFFISLFQSNASLVSICVLWIYGLLVFGFCRSVLQCRLVFSDLWNLWSLIFVFQLKLNPTVVYPSLIRLDPWFFTISDRFIALPPDQIRSVPSWAQTRIEPTRGHP